MALSGDEMNKFKKEVPIFLSIDDNYLPFLAVAVESIKEHADKNVMYKIMILSEKITKLGKEKISAMQSDNVDVSFVDVSKKIEPIRKELKESLRDYYTESIFYRMFIASLFPNLDKAIYIDSDVVLLDDIQNLYDIDLGNNVLGVIVDQVVSVCEPFKHYTLNALGVPASDYFNSGVLLMNLSEYRKRDIEGKFLNMLLTYNPESVAPDQDYLNVLCYGSVKYLSAGWDRMPTAEIDYNGKLHLIHYNMFNKPWKYSDVMFEEYFWEYAKKTEYYDFLLNMRANYSDEQKKADASGGEILVKNALRIADEGRTFVKAINELSEKRERSWQKQRVALSMKSCTIQGLTY